MSIQSLRAIDSLRKEFFSLLKDTGLIDGNPSICNSEGNDANLTRAVICYGMYPGICSVVVSTSPEFICPAVASLYSAVCFIEHLYDTCSIMRDHFP